MEIIIKINIDGNEVKDVKVETEKEVIVQDVELNNREISNYARFFNEGCPSWTKDSEYNLEFLKAQQRYANDMLQRREHLFLNEVYDLLGIPRTRAGAVLGWIYDKEHPYGHNFVDFGIYDERNRDFINGIENVALLDFNVDGNILDYI